MIVHKLGKYDSFVVNFRRKFYTILRKILAKYIATPFLGTSDNFTPRLLVHRSHRINQRREKVIEKLVESTPNSLYSKDA